MYFIYDHRTRADSTESIYPQSTKVSVPYVLIWIGCKFQLKISYAGLMHLLLIMKVLASGLVAQIMVKSGMVTLQRKEAVSLIMQ